MNRPTEYQKKLYLVIGMAIMGGILFVSIYAFKSEDSSSDNTVSQGNIVSPQTDFNITLDTLDANSRSAFYRKERERDTVLMVNPFDKKKEQGTGNQILDATSVLEKEASRKPSRNNFNEDLWDMDSPEEPTNLGLGTEAEKQASYRAGLLKAREERLARSQDYSAPQQNMENQSDTDSFLEFQASIYRDQFILPGDRVILILNNPISYKDNVFKKNTFIYAIANIQGSRVMMNVTNIDHVPVALKVKDIADGNVGMYSQRAGELWREFQGDTQTQGVNRAGTELAQQSNSQLLGAAITSFGRFFRKKKYRERDKILLVNNDKLILSTR
ncbi:MAG: conjugative transposon protein TraM [Maribacter sp.]|nr:conjugative transposon protein TraM [Maribacter sp.]